MILAWANLPGGQGESREKMAVKMCLEEDRIHNPSALRL